MNDGGYRAISGIPHEYTYGTTVYKKGADVVHTLRGYMGDKDFLMRVKIFKTPINLVPLVVMI